MARCLAILVTPLTIDGRNQEAFFGTAHSFDLSLSLAGSTSVGLDLEVHQPVYIVLAGKSGYWTTQSDDPIRLSKVIRQTADTSKMVYFAKAPKPGRRFTFALSSLKGFQCH